MEEQAPDRALVIVPTYNEAENVLAVIEQLMNLPEPVSVLIVDDGSPDGTAGRVRSMQTQYPDRVHLRERSGKQGLGTAYILGFRFALDHEKISDAARDAMASALRDLKPGASLRGNLLTTPLACVLSCVDAARTSGELRFDHPEARGVLPLAEGRLLDFESDTPSDRTGDECIDHLLRCGSSDFVLSRMLGVRNEPHSARVLDILWRNMHAAHS